MNWRMGGRNISLLYYAWFVWLRVQVLTKIRQDNSVCVWGGGGGEEINLILNSFKTTLSKNFKDLY